MDTNLHVQQQWEYKVFTVSPRAVDLGESLNRFGDAHWELVAGIPVVHSYAGSNTGIGTNLLLLFKRVRQS